MKVSNSKSGTKPFEINEGEYYKNRYGLFFIESIEVCGPRVKVSMNTVSEPIRADNLASGPKLRKSVMNCWVA